MADVAILCAGNMVARLRPSMSTVTLTLPFNVPQVSRCQAFARERPGLSASQSLRRGAVGREGPKDS